MSNQGVDPGRRRFLTLTTAVVGGAGIVAATVPFLASWKPSERAKALGAPVEVDISKMEAGQRLVVAWRGKPTWVLKRTPEMLASLKKVDNDLLDPKCKADQQPDYIKGEARAIKPEILVLIGVRSEEHTSEHKSLMRISYDVFCLKKKTHQYTSQTK